MVESMTWSRIRIFFAGEGCVANLSSFVQVHALEALRIANHNSVQEDCGGGVVLREKVGLLEQSHKRKRGVCGNLQFFTPLAGTLPPCNFSPGKTGTNRSILADWKGWRAA
jgi:hypothetical protein